MCFLYNYQRSKSDLLKAIGVVGIVIVFKLDGLALFCSRHKDEQDGDEQHDGCSEAALKSEFAAAQNSSEIVLLCGEQGVGHGCAADVKAENVALGKVPGGVDGADRPDTSAAKRDYRCEEAEEGEVYKSDNTEACVPSVEEGKEQR